MLRRLTVPIFFLTSLAAAPSPTTQPVVQIKELAPGKSGAETGDVLFVTYTGKLKNGTVFDSNVGGQLFRFTLGSGEVIKGWDEGMAGMKVGEKRELIIPPELAYGAKASGRIPANSTLNFTVELVGLVRIPK